MNAIWNGLTYSYNRNIGWQDRAIRTVCGLLAMAGAIYFFQKNFTLSAILGGLSLAQVITVFSSRCMICYFLGRCTITASEQKALRERGVPFES